MSKSNHNDTLTIAGIVLAAIAFILAVTWVIQGNEFFLTKVFSPRMEQVRRETFEQSKAYTEGNAQELRRMQLEYIQAKPEQQDALASVILHQFAGVDESKLPPDLRAFLDQIKTKTEGTNQ